LFPSKKTKQWEKLLLPSKKELRDYKAICSHLKKQSNGRSYYSLQKKSLGTIKLFVPIKKNKAMGEAITPFKKRA
jgi:hypothetical protein